MATLGWITRLTMFVAAIICINFAIAGLIGFNGVGTLISIFHSSVLTNFIYILVGISGLVVLGKMR